LPEPDIDTLGQGFIVYWPTLPWVAVAPTLEDRVNEALDNAEVNKLYIVRKLLALADEILVEMRISNNGDNRKRVPELVLSQQGLTDVRKNIDDYLRRTE
jgi:1,2-phenylacetyl-CoA epoxidase catalytic subunit